MIIMDTKAWLAAKCKRQLMKKVEFPKTLRNQWH